MGPTRLTLSKPVIAAVEGYAVAGGIELALWCDLRVAAEDAVFGVFCRRFGVPLVDLGTVRLPRIVGHGRAMDLILTGRAVAAPEALDHGTGQPGGRSRPGADGGGGAGAPARRAAPGVPALGPDERPGAVGTDRGGRRRRGGPARARRHPERRNARRRARALREVRDAVALRSSDPAGNGPVAPGRPTVAAFDFDGTLTDSGSVFPFLVSVRGAWPVLRAVTRLSPSLLRAAVVGGSAADDVKERLFHRLLGGLPVEEVDRRSVVFAHRHLQRHLRQDTRRRLEWHRRQGHYTVIVSASPECYVSPAGEELGVDGVVATRLAVGGGGLLTGGYEGKNCRGAEKYARLIVHLRAQGLLSNNGGVQPVLWAYGNSRGDLRLLNAADHGVDAGRLGPLGRLRRFPRLSGVLASAGSGRDADRVP